MSTEWIISAIAIITIVVIAWRGGGHRNRR